MLAEKTNQNSNLNETIVSRIDEFLSALEITEYNIHKECVYMPCPVHGGNNEAGCKIFLKETLKYPVNWKCFTNQCEKQYGKGFIGLVSGVKKLSKKDAKLWVEKFIGGSIESYTNVDDRLINQVLQMDREEGGLSLTREYVLSTLDLAPKFYLDKNFSKDTLIKYDVGISKQKGSTYYNKIVVPVYDDNREKVVGFTMRTQNPQCKKCKLFHTGGCPSTFLEKNACNKWMNSGFNKTNYLYNFWFAKNMINKHGSVVLVEGPADVWRIVESGIENVVALLGVELSDAQKIILEKCGVRNIIMFTDPDQAGENAINKVKELCGHMYNIIPIRHPKEPADLTSQQNLDILLPILRRIK